MKTIAGQINCFAIFSVLTVSLCGCSSNAESVAGVGRGDGDDKSFYKEIFFGSAKESKLSHVKDVISSRQKMPIEARKEFEEIEAVLAEAIAKINPDFYKEFNRKIQSGDHLLIEEALNEGGQILEKSLYATPELTEAVLLGE